MHALTDTSIKALEKNAYNLSYLLTKAQSILLCASQDDTKGILNHAYDIASLLEYNGQFVSDCYTPFKMVANKECTLR